jgi:hypothetical protein
MPIIPRTVHITPVIYPNAAAAMPKSPQDPRQIHAMVKQNIPLQNGASIFLNIFESSGIAINVSTIPWNIDIIAVINSVTFMNPLFLMFTRAPKSS